MNWNQIYKLLKVAFIALLVMFVFEIIFSIPAVTGMISTFILSVENKIWIWIVLWLIMFLQVSVIPVPAYIVINAAIQLEIVNKSLGFGMLASNTFWTFILVTMSAYMIGILVAYFIGHKWGRKAVKWSAGSDEEYDKWANFLNEKGKIWYALSVILPIFPDDLLCIVAGAVKFDFKWFIISNLVGRFVGLIVSILFFALISSVNSGGFPWTVVIWGMALLAIGILALWIRKRKINTV